MILELRAKQTFVTQRCLKYQIEFIIDEEAEKLKAERVSDRSMQQVSKGTSLLQLLMADGDDKEEKEQSKPVVRIPQLQQLQQTPRVSVADTLVAPAARTTNCTIEARVTQELTQGPSRATDVRSRSRSRRWRQEGIGRLAAGGGARQRAALEQAPDGE